MTTGDEAGPPPGRGRVAVGAVITVLGLGLLWGPRGGLPWALLLLAAGAVAQLVADAPGSRRAHRTPRDAASRRVARDGPRDRASLVAPAGEGSHGSRLAATSGAFARRTFALQPGRWDAFLFRPVAWPRHGAYLLAGVLVVAAVVRFPGLHRIPAGLYCDEAAIGYNAYSILETGRDEHGTLLPLFVPSFGVSFKNPVYLYAAIPAIAVFGLDEASLRSTSGAFGIAAVGALYLLGAALYGQRVGLVAALLLAVSPWHVHFSRVAFELISLPALFVAGLALAARYLGEGGRRRHLVLAAVLFGLTPYAYAVASVFVPAMLFAFALLHRAELRRRWRDVAVAGAVLAAVLVPFILFHLLEPLSMQRFGLIGIVQPGRPWSEVAGHFAANYRQYLSADFLFHHGDPIVRHAVRGYGQNLASLAPWVGLGLAGALRRPRHGALLVAWLLAFPVAAALVNETPSATRSIVGAPLFPLLAAIGLAGAWEALGRLRRLGVRRSLRAGMLALAVLTIGGEAVAYLRELLTRYPAYSAPGLDGFQYGYRESIAAMEARRADYDRLVLTATHVNQPWIFPLFYNGRDPAAFQRTQDTGYEVFVPEEIGRYDPAKERILYQAHPRDLHMFEDYRLVEDVFAPGGQLVFRIVEPLRRRSYLVGWRVVTGLPPQRGADPDPLAALPAEAQWRQLESPFVHVDLNRSIEGNPENMCAVAATEVDLATPERAAFLQCVGTEDLFRPFVDGRPLGEAAILDREAPRRFPLALGPGAHRLAALSCETVGDWHFACAIVDSDGRSLVGRPTAAPAAAAAPGAGQGPPGGSS